MPSSNERTCLRCGGKYIWNFGYMNGRHICKPPTEVRIYTDEEKKEFERRRKAGEV